MLVDGHCRKRYSANLIQAQTHAAMNATTMQSSHRTIAEWRDGRIVFYTRHLLFKATSGNDLLHHMPLKATNGEMVSCVNCQGYQRKWSLASYAAQGYQRKWSLASTAKAIHESGL
jgi:hypothetical protein